MEAFMAADANILSILSRFHSFLIKGDDIHMSPIKEKISITIDNDILSKLKNEAEKDDRSLSQYINLILKQHISRTEETKKP